MGDDYLNEKINLDGLYTRAREVKHNKIKIFNKILGRVHKKIKLMSVNNPDDKHVFFLVPEFLLGTQSYDVNVCTSYLMEKLSKNGFKLKYTHPNLLFISWKHYIPDYERMEIKKKHGVVVDGFGNIKTDNNKPTEPDSLGDAKHLLLKNTNKQEKNDKDYKKIDAYKPSGKFIYSEELLKTLEKNID
jgi:hypothetical protein